MLIERCAAVAAAAARLDYCDHFDITVSLHLEHFEIIFHFAEKTLLTTSDLLQI